MKKSVAFMVSFFLFAVLIAHEANARKLTAIEKKSMESIYLTAVAGADLTPQDLENYSIGQSHIDAAWKWRLHQTHDKCIKTFSNAVKHMEMYPDFHYSQSAPQYYEWVKHDDPALFERIKHYEKKGQWEIVGGQWVEPDNVMPDGESFVRQRLLGMRFYKEHFGHTPEISWLLDSFGYQWNLPQILAKSGARYFWTNKLTWNDTTVFPFHFFWWQSPDGSRVLAYFVKQSHYPANFPTSELSKYYHTRYLLPEGKELIADYSVPYDTLPERMSDEWLNVVGIFYGKGDGGHGPTNNEIQAQLYLQEKGHTRIAPAHRLYNEMEPYADRAPVWNDELYLEYHRGTLTTQGWIKRANREAEEMMRTAEVLQSISMRLGFEYAYEKLKEIWKLVLLNQFHDILPGSSIPEVYEDAKKQYRTIREGASGAAFNALSFLASRTNTEGEIEGTPVVVFNTLSWERSGVVEIADGRFSSPSAVFDSSGSPAPFQEGRCRSDVDEDCLFFMASGVPSVGHEVYYIVEGDDAFLAKGPAVSEEADKISLSNGLVSVKVDKGTGWLSSVKDLTSGRELLSGHGNRLRAWHDHASAWPAWNIQTDYLDHEKDMPDASDVKVVAEGPLFAEVVAERDFNDSKILQYIRIYKGDARVHLTTRFDFHEPDTLVKAGFDTNIKTDKIAAETSYAVIERPTRPDTAAERARWEASCHRYIDLSDGEQGLALLNNGKYGYSLNSDGTGYRLTLLKAAQYPESAGEAVDVEHYRLPYLLRTLLTLDRQTDQGPHTAWTALYPHQGDWKEARLWQAGYEFNTPLEVYVTDRHSGGLSAKHSFIEVDNPDVYLGALKKAEDDDSLVLRLIEAGGKSGRAEVGLAGFGGMGKAFETDLLEWGPEPLDSVDGGPEGPETTKARQRIALDFSPYEIKTVKIAME